ncbi:MAG: ATP-binding protein [Candidatus Cloacimonetes bacterium]|nr:ATP-binding protein [Candidatus Cloacimonadota bacterium]
MKKSFFSQLFSAFLLVIVTMSGITIFFSYRNFKTEHVNTLSNHLFQICKIVETVSKDYLFNSDYTNLDKFIKGLGYKIDERITIVDANGKVLADSDENPLLMENHGGRLEISTALKNGFGSSQRYSKTLNEEMLYIAIPIFDGDKTIGVVRSSIYSNSIESALKSFRRKIIITAIILISIFLIIASWFTINITNPLNQLTEAALKVSKGNFSQKIILKKSSVLKEFSDNFNSMTDQLSSSFRKITSQTDELNELVESMPQGIAVISSSGKVLRINKNIRTIFNIPDIFIHSDYWTLFKNNWINALIEKTLSTSLSQNSETEIDNATYLCSTSNVLNDRTILILLDVSEIKKTKLIKRDFSVNVSHELRTPLTAIKGFLETLEDGVKEEYSQYLDILKRHTERLINIVNDLLTLSELERDDSILCKENVKVETIVSNVTQIFQHRLKTKKIELFIQIEENLPPLFCDPFRMEQVLINLFDNALKYTEVGKITIQANRKNEEIVISIIDTGIGIADAHFDRIFERFYVVDKSRSRKHGGTGLGLSIVKHIVELHKGRIVIDSTVSKGTEVEVFIPLGSNSE